MTSIIKKYKSLSLKMKIQLITALLTDYARPRLMIESERNNFLREMFGHM